jgi:DNA-binding IclR family transcriptional regulator
MLAFQNAEFVDRMLQSHRFTAYTSATLRSASQLRLHLDTVRKQGFAIDDEEFEAGLRCVGAPVRDHSGRVVAAISIAGPAFRITRERLPTLVEQVVNAAAELSVCLGHYQDRVAGRERHRISEEEPVELT